MPRVSPVGAAVKHWAAANTTTVFDVSDAVLLLPVIVAEDNGVVGVTLRVAVVPLVMEEMVVPLANAPVPETNERGIPTLRPVVSPTVKVVPLDDAFVLL